MTALKDIEYEYVGRSILTLDDHHPELDIDFHKGDKFTLKVVNNEAHIKHEAAPREVFKCRFNDKLYIRLMRNIKQTSFVFVPHPKNPSYPMITKQDKNTMEMLYLYFNERYFNNVLPDIKHVVFQTKIPKNYTQPAAGLMESTHLRTKTGLSRRKYRVSVDESYNDPFVFVDVLLHEMIHVYQGEMAQKNPNDAKKIFAGNAHGAWFQKEMRRINKDGFNIDTVLDWEKRDSSVTSEHFLVGIHMATEGKRGQVLASSLWFWSPKEIEKAELAKVLDIFGTEFTYHEIFATQHRTSSHEFRALFPRFPKRLTASMPGRARSHRLADVEKIAKRHMETELQPATFRDFSRPLSIPKHAVKFMTGTMDEYLKAVKAGRVTDFGQPERAYQQIKIADVAKAAEADIIRLGRLVAMRGDSQRIKQDADRIRESFSSRYTERQLVPVLRKAVERQKLSSQDTVMELLKI